jgi:hypothetical protein
MKYATSFRISDQARALLDRMAQDISISHTAMLEILIREGAKKRGIRADSRVQAESQSSEDARH